MFAPAKKDGLRLRYDHPVHRFRLRAGVRRRSGEQFEIYGAYRRKLDASSTTGETLFKKCLTIYSKWYAICSGYVANRLLQSNDNPARGFQ
jgi:hypothetical protein